MEDKLDMSLEEIIQQGYGKKSGIKPNNNLKVKGSNVNMNYNRAQRSPKPYDTEHHFFQKPIPSMAPLNQEGFNFEVKILVSHFLAGLLIGQGGTKIRKFSAATQTIIHASSQEELYPGTNCRYIKVRGEFADVINVVSIIWELIALEETEQSLEAKNIWIPSDRRTHHFDRVHVEGKVVVPAACVGSIIGTGMSVMKSISESTGATVHFAKRFEPSLPGCSDRAVTITGSVSGCAAASELVLKKACTYLETKAASEDIILPRTRSHSHPARLTVNATSRPPTVGQYSQPKSAITSTRTYSTQDYEDQYADAEGYEYESVTADTEYHMGNMSTSSLRSRRQAPQLRLSHDDHTRK